MLNIDSVTMMGGNYEGRQWAPPSSPELSQTMGTFYEKKDTYSVDARGLTDYYAYSTIKHIGAGQYYLITTKDKDRRVLDGARNYRLNVPADAPVNQYWSATVYDRATHALIRDVSRPSRSSQSQGLQKESDGSVNIYFGPEAPAGKEPNWVPTNANGKFEVLFRFYGPKKSLFDKTWKLPDIEEVK